MPNSPKTSHLNVLNDNVTWDVMSYFLICFLFTSLYFHLLAIGGSTTFNYPHYVGIRPSSDPKFSTGDLPTVPETVPKIGIISISRTEGAPVFEEDNTTGKTVADPEICPGRPDDS